LRRSPESAERTYWDGDVGVIGYNRWSLGRRQQSRRVVGRLARAHLCRHHIGALFRLGLAIHRNSKYTLTIASLGGKAAVLLSIDLAGAVTGTSEAWRDEVPGRALGPPTRPAKRPALQRAGERAALSAAAHQWSSSSIVLAFCARCGKLLDVPCPAATPP